MVVISGMVLLAMLGLSYPAKQWEQEPKELNVSQRNNFVNGEPWDDEGVVVPSGQNFGRDPYLCVVAREDNTLDIAWWDMDKGEIHISRTDRNDSIVSEIKCSHFAGLRTQLEGFCRLPSDGSYIVGYSKVNKKKDGSEYWIARIGTAGNLIWDRKVFGGDNMSLTGCKCCPGSGGTARIAYHTASGILCYFLGHNQRWGDGVSHQASMVGFISQNGVVLSSGDSWYISHDLDQRLIALDSSFYLLSLGDAHPRGVVLSSWKPKKEKVESGLFSTIFSIPGSTGDNYTGTRLGGMVALSNGNLGILISTNVGRERQELYYMIVNRQGKTLSKQWLSSHSEGDAEYPQLVKRGKNRVLVSCKTNYGETTLFYELDEKGILLRKKAIERNYGDLSTEIKFSLTHDMVSCPNGDIAWVSGNFREKKITVYRIRY